MTSRLDLLPAIALHVVLGAALLAVLWSAGIGYAQFVLRWRALEPAPLFALGYALGLLLGCVAAVLVLLHPLGAVPAVALEAVGIALFVRAHGARTFRAPLVSAALAAPFVVLGATLFGLFYHGPSHVRGSNMNGDMLLYIAKLSSARLSIAPFRDLLVAGQHFTLTEGAPTFLGAAVAWLPGFDPFLFDAVALPTFAGLALTAGVGSLALGSSAPKSPRRTVALALALVGASAVVYPSWLVESPPVVLALPLAFAVFWLSRVRLTVSELMLGAAVVAIGLALTKVIALVFLAVVVAARLLLRDVAPEPRRRSLGALAVVVALAAAAVAGMARDSGQSLVLLSDLTFGPANALRALRRELQHALHIPWGLLTVVGQVIPVAVLARSRRFVLAAALAVAVVENWVEQGIVDISGVAFGLLATVCVYLLDPGEAERQRVGIAAVGVLLTLAAVGREFTGTYLGPLLVLCVAAAFLAASRSLDLPLLLAFALAAAVCIGGRHVAAVPVLWALLLAGWAAVHDAPRARTVAAATILVGCIAYVVAAATLPPVAARTTAQDWSFWRTVHRVVPADALVFTSFTGESVTERTGWNYYPAVAKRQLFIAGWADSPLQAAAAADERRARLAANDRVLTGHVAPADAPYAAGYGSYWAAVAAGVRVPPGFTRVATVGPYALYRID